MTHNIKCPYCGKTVVIEENDLFDEDSRMVRCPNLGCGLEFACAAVPLEEPDGVASKEESAPTNET